MILMRIYGPHKQQVEFGIAFLASNISVRYCMIVFINIIIRPGTIMKKMMQDMALILQFSDT